MKKITLDEQKKLEVEMLKYIKKVCEENDLKLYLGGGTLLGAVRHKGFIPWDDDIDVMMMRDDYEKLIDLFKDNEIGNIKILSYKYNSDYYYPFAKAVATNTVLEENNMKKIKDFGVYIDIFPIDYIPNSRKEEKRIFNKRKIYQSIINFNSMKNVYIISKSIIKKIYKFIFGPIFRCFSITYGAKKMDELLKKYNSENSENVICLSGAYMEKEIMSKEYISNSVEVEFEGEKYLAPIDYNTYLIKHYGLNYMQIPPKEKQISNHDNVAYWK